MLNPTCCHEPNCNNCQKCADCQENSQRYSYSNLARMNQSITSSRSSLKSNGSVRSNKKVSFDPRISSNDDETNFRPSVSFYDFEIERGLIKSANNSQKEQRKVIEYWVYDENENLKLVSANENFKDNTYHLSKNVLDNGEHYLISHYKNQY